jgi:hypothetical protein
MPATLVPEKIETTVIAATSIDAVPEEAKSAGSDALCYLCKPAEANEAIATCHYCEKPICKVHRRTVRQSCQTLYDACPDCKATKLQADIEAYRRFRENSPLFFAGNPR